jgi:chromosome segregation ATPase
MHSILTGEPPPSKTNVRDTTIYPRTPKFPIKSLRRNENIHPNPPDLPKPSSNQSYLGSVSFQPYRSTRPQLLVEINAIVEAGLRDLEGRADTPSPRLSVYRMAFQRFIDEFTIYGPFLQSVKHEYDDCIDQLWERLREVATVHADLAVKDEEHAVLSRSVHKAHKEEVKALQEKIKSLELALVRKDHDVQNAQQAAAEAKDQFEKRLDEIEELRKANDMLVRSLTQLEADKAICEARELEKSGEIVTLHATIQKNLEDADK